MNRTVGIILTVVTTLCCACVALFLCIFGGLIAIGQPVTMNGTNVIYPSTYGIVLLCLSVIFIVIPIAVAFFTFRKKPAPAVASNYNAPIPPAS